MSQPKYSIPLRHLPNGKHEFSFDCGDDLFAGIEGALAQHGQLHADVQANKSDEMMTLDFDISGSLNLQCDVCLGHFDFPIEDCGERITLKMGSKDQELDDDLYEVDANAEYLDLGQWIYEMACVLIPLRVEHPLDEDGNPTCDPDVLREMDKYIVRSEEDLERRKREAEAEAGDSDFIDPRWAALKQLKGDD